MIRSGISECQRTYTTTDSGLTQLLHDLSPDGGTYQRYYSANF